ncbi:MAG: AEC family transporter [Solirubrobacterales bacterium]|nr:AEC family transporter [Solirubrobacterales bacterium]
MGLVALAIVASAGVGVAADLRFRERAEAASRRVMDFMVWVLMPPIIFLIAARTDLGGGVGAGILLGYLELATVGLLAYLLGTRVLRLPRPSVGTLIVVVILANTGYLGIPLNAALLGRDAIAPAIAWDTAVSNVVLYTAAFAVGASFGTTAGETPRERAKAFLTRNPVLFAVVAGLLAPDALAPDALVDAAEVVSFALLPLGFFILGVNLMHERDDGSLTFPPPLTAPVATALALRLLAAPALLVAFSALLVDVPDAYVVQAAMASGINSLIVSHLYGLDLRLAASTIAWGTAIVVVAALAASPLV